MEQIKCREREKVERGEGEVDTDCEPVILNIGNGLPTCRLITGVDMFIDCFVPCQGTVRAICTNC